MKLVPCLLFLLTGCTAFVNQAPYLRTLTPYTVRNSGYCNWPVKNPGTMSRVVYIPFSEVKQGMCVIFCPSWSCGEPVSHFVMQVTAQGLVTKGLRNLHVDPGYTTPETYVGVEVFGDNSLYPVKQ